MRITTISDGYINFVVKHEGLFLKPYLCPAGVWTIGIGSTYYPNGKRVKESDPVISKEFAYFVFKEISHEFEREIDSLTRDDITQNQFNALFDFAYNAGIGALKSSTLLKKVNLNPNDPTIRNEFNKWIYGGDGSHNKKDDDGDGLIDEPGEKQRLEGLVKRRKECADMYFTL